MSLCDPQIFFLILGVSVGIANSPAISEDECLADCKTTDGCEWYTYDTSQETCSFLQNCPFMDTGCTTCVHGEDQCDIVNEAFVFHKIMMIGGQSSPQATEMHDIAGRYNCSATQPLDLPRSLYAGASAFVVNRYNCLLFLVKLAIHLN